MSIATAMTRIRNLRAESIAIRRGSSTLTAQTMRIERTSRGRLSENVQASERRADVVINMAISADIAVRDRFNDSNGLLYEVTFVRPNRSVATFAEAIVIE